MCATAVSSNTKLTIDWGICVWSDWANNRASMPTPDGVVSVTTPLLAMTPTQLSHWMGKFLLEICKKDGKECLPKTLYVWVCCFK